MSYHSFIDDEGKPYGSFECWHVNADEATHMNECGVTYMGDEGPTAWTEGWYWQPCFPGCMPDGPASGPFVSEAEALADAQG